MHVEQSMFAAIGAIYATTLSINQWSAALDEVAMAVGGNGAMLMVRDASAEELSINQTSSRYRSEDVNEYVQSIDQGDESRWMTALDHSPPRTIVTDLDIWPDRAVYDQMASVRYMRSLQLYHRCAARLCSHGGWHDVLAVLFREERAGITALESDRLQMLLPHLARALEVHRPFVLLERRYHAVLSVLDRLGIGVAILRGDRQIVTANQEAMRLLEARDGLHRDSAGRLAATGDDAARFSHAVTQVARAAALEGQCDDTVLFIPRASRQEPYVVDMAPLRDVEALAEPFIGVLVLLIDPEHRAMISTDGLAHTYGLTLAEKAVCRLVANGMTAREIADDRNVSIGTIKSQTRTIFAKTSTRNRAELVRRAHSIVPPLIDSGGRRIN